VSATPSAGRTPAAERQSSHCDSRSGGNSSTSLISPHTTAHLFRPLRSELWSARCQPPCRHRAGKLQREQLNTTELPARARQYLLQCGQFKASRCPPTGTAAWLAPFGQAGAARPGWCRSPGWRRSARLVPLAASATAIDEGHRAGPEYAGHAGLDRDPSARSTAGGTGVCGRRRASRAPPARRRPALLAIHIGFSIAPLAAGLLAGWSYTALFVIDGGTMATAGPRHRRRRHAHRAARYRARPGLPALSSASLSRRR
jgi:hypothetical protein